MISGFELLPYHIILLVAISFFIYGLAKKSILISCLSSIMLMLCGLFGVANGFPYISGTTASIVGDTTTTLNTITYQTNWIIQLSSVLIMILGVISFILVWFDLWKEEGW